MRAAPIGLFFAGNPTDLIRAADEQGRITHTDRRCSAGSVAIAGCVALAMRGPFDSEKWLLQLSAWVAKMDEAFGQYILELREWLKLSPEDAVVPISRCGLAPGYQDGWKNISPFVVSSVIWSLYCFFRSPDDYMETIRTAIVVGGDVDSTAAMAGAIAGTYLGIDGLPADLSRLITDQGTWEYDELIDLAHRCYDLNFGEVS
jgi:ADP-ribosylglycohydrolase